MKFDRLHKQYLKENKLLGFKQYLNKEHAKPYDYKIISTKEKIEEIFGQPKLTNNNLPTWSVKYPNNIIPLKLIHYSYHPTRKDESVYIFVEGDKNKQVENIQNFLNSFKNDVKFEWYEAAEPNNPSSILYSRVTSGEDPTAIKHFIGYINKKTNPQNEI